MIQNTLKSRLQCKNNQILRIPVITISRPEEIENGQCNKLFDLDDVIILKIQDYEIISDKYLPPLTFPEEELNPITFNLSFIATHMNQPVEEKIKMENKGVFAISYTWHNITVPKQRKNKIKVFHFNNTSDIILPGQIVIFSVWYNFQEELFEYENIDIWELKTDPKISFSPIIFNFQGYYTTPPASLYNHMSEWSTCNEEIINEHFNLQLYESIREIIWSLVENLKSTKDMWAQFSIAFNESKIFLLKNPNYIYHPDIVDELKQMYNIATGNSSSLWDLSIKELRDILLTMNSDDANKKRIMLQKFFTLCRNSLQPSYYIIVMNTKYEVSYNILCSFANKFDDESELVKRYYLKTPTALSSIMPREIEQLCSHITQSTSVLIGARECSERTKIRTISQLLFRSNSLPVVCSMTTSSLKRNTDKSHTQDDNEKTTQREAINLYLEILFVRIHFILSDTIIKICRVIDSINDIIEDKN